MSTDNQLVPVVREWTLPDPSETRSQLQAIRAFQQACQQHLAKDHDYGTIPGTQRPTLLKPGAEKIARLLGLADEYDILEDVKDWDKGFFHFQVRCRLVHLGTGTPVTTGLGECNSMESRYRYRWVWERELPEGFQKEGAVYRTTRNGGKQYRIENEDIYSQVNTILKMAKKRALVDAALSAGRLSEIFTQDMEDLGPQTEYSQEPPSQPQQQTRQRQAQPRKQAPSEPPAEETTILEGEAPDSESQSHQSDYTAVLEKAGGYGLDEEAFLEQVIGKGMTWAEFEKLGGSPDIAEKRLEAWASKKK